MLAAEASVEAEGPVVADPGGNELNCSGVRLITCCNKADSTSGVICRCEREPEFAWLTSLQKEDTSLIGLSSMLEFLQSYSGSFSVQSMC
nr:hypothetical protein Iba_chr12aCG6300 [Ipomoea batatas]